MPEWLQWTLGGIAGVAMLYLLFFFIVLLFISNFNKRLKKRREALRLLLAQRKDITLALFQKVVEAKIQVTIAIQNKINELSNKEIGLFNHYEIFGYAPELEKVSKIVFELAEANKTLKKSDEYIQFVKELAELDEMKRQHIAIYNADINGYNYWIKLMSYRHILKRLGFHEKKRLE
ncbi:MAG: hypothetical protein WCX85_03930 [Bacilli bacterium]|jgi:hypothetical protein|nr:hypothetical protein [Bacilli bacterium]